MLSLKEISDVIATLCNNYDVEEIYIFGSYARGEADELSDIDIAIRAPKMTIMQISSLSYKIECALKLDVDMIPMDVMDEVFLKKISEEAVKVI